MTSDAPQTPPKGLPAAALPADVRWRRWGGYAFRVARIFAVPYLVILLLMMWMEEDLLFHGTLSSDDDWKPAGLVFEDARFEAADGTRLHGWYVPHDAPRAVVLYAHGNAGNLSHRAPRLKALHAMGVSVMIFDYRGYGHSAGSPNELGILQDARAARAWLAERAGISEREIVLLGKSLGGGVMVDLAAKDGARALILESTFGSLPETGASHYPWLPVHYVMKNRLDSLSKIADYHGPLLQSHGEEDEVIPYASGRNLFERANPPKTFIPVPGGTHNHRPSLEYDRALEAFFKEL